MKLQYAFGNPRRKKKKSKGSKKRRKSVAKRHKSKKTKSVKSKLRKAVKHMAAKRRKKKRNPEGARISRDGRRIGTEYSPLNEREARAAEGQFIGLMKKYKNLPLGNERAAVMKEMAALKRKLGRRASFLKILERYKESGAKITTYDLQKKAKGEKVAKKKKKSKKAKKASKKKSSKKKTTKRKSTKKKSTKRKSTKRKGTKRKGSKKRGQKRRRSKMITHRHAKTTRHIRKGTRAKVSARKRKGSYKIKTHFGRGKKKVKMTGRLRQGKKGSLRGSFKINPFRRNPMDQIKRFTGLDNREIQLLAIGAAAAPISSAAMKYIPGINIVTAQVARFVPVQYQSAVMNLLLGAAMNVGSEYVPAGGAKKTMAMVGEGLAAASIIGLVAGGVSDLLKMTGFAGINYTPAMRGMGIVPQLNGVNYTPNGMRGMGAVEYTPRNMGSRADFGSADYGGGGGYTEAHNRSRADFGANFSEDSEAEGLEDQDNSYSSSMN